LYVLQSSVSLRLALSIINCGKRWKSRVANGL